MSIIKSSYVKYNIEPHIMLFNLKDCDYCLLLNLFSFVFKKVKKIVNTDLRYNNLFLHNDFISLYNLHNCYNDFANLVNKFQDVNFNNICKNILLCGNALQQNNTTAISYKLNNKLWVVMHMLFNIIEHYMNSDELYININANNTNSFNNDLNDCRNVLNLNLVNEDSNIELIKKLINLNKKYRYIYIEYTGTLNININNIIDLCSKLSNNIIYYNIDINTNLVIADTIEYTYKDLNCIFKKYIDLQMFYNNSKIYYINNAAVINKNENYNDKRNKIYRFLKNYAKNSIILFSTLKWFLH